MEIQLTQLNPLQQGDSFLEEMKRAVKEPIEEHLTFEITSNETLESALNCLYRHSQLIRGTSKVIDIYGISKNNKTHIYNLWILANKCMFEYKIYKNIIVFKYETTLGMWRTNMKKAKVYKDVKVNALLNSIVISKELIGLIFTSIKNKAYLMPYSNPKQLIEFPHELLIKEKEGYDFGRVYQNEKEFWIINVVRGVCLFDITTGIYYNYVQGNDINTAKFITIKNKLFLITPHDTLMKVSVGKKKMKEIKKKERKYYVLSQFIRQFEHYDISYTDITTAADIIKNGITPVQFEYLITNSKSKVINALHSYILNEIANLSKPMNVFMSSLLDFNEGESFDIIAITVKILLYKRDYKKLIELFTQLHNQLKEQQLFYLAEQLPNKFFEHLPFFEDSKNISIEVLFPSDKLVVNKDCPEFLGLLSGLIMVRCFFLIQMGSYIEVLKTILSIESEEMKIQVLKSFISSVKEKVNDFQRHQMLKLIFSSGITNKDFI